LGKFDAFKLSKFLTQRVFYSSYEIGQSNYSIEHILENKQLVVMKLHPHIFNKEDRYKNMQVDDGEAQQRNEEELEAFKLLGFRTHHAHFYYSKDFETANEYYQRICKNVEPKEEVKNASFVVMNPDDDVCYLFEDSLVHPRYDGKLVPDKKSVNNGLNFVKKHQHPLIMQFTEKMALMYQKKNLPYVTYFTAEGKNTTNITLRQNQRRPQLEINQGPMPNIPRPIHLHFHPQVLSIKPSKQIRTNTLQSLGSHT
jgi:hypothetical protein